MPELLISALLAMAAGASAVTQQAINANLKTALNSAAWSGFISYAVGLACMAVIVAVMRDPIPAGVASRIPLWSWSAGVFGALFIFCGIVLVPRLGTGTFIALVIAGQMLTSLAFDHYALFGLEQRPTDLTRLLGAALLIGGALLIQR